MPKERVDKNTPPSMDNNLNTTAISANNTNTISAFFIFSGDRECFLFNYTGNSTE